MTDVGLSARPTKLRDGTWGARVPGKAVSGQRVMVESKSGKRWHAIVDRVIWHGQDRYGDGTVTIVSTRSADRSAGRRNVAQGYCGYPCPVTGKRCCPENGPCHDCL